MPTTIVGERSVFETVGSSVEIGNYKTREPLGATVQFHDTSAKNVGKSYFTAGTKYGDFKVAQSTIQANTASGSVTYKSSSDEDVVYTMDYATSAEPIDTHPNFNAIADHAAIYDPDGSFRKFKHTITQEDIDARGPFQEPLRNAKGEQAKDGEQNLYAGVSSYLEASGVWTMSFKSRRVPTLMGLGRISEPSGSAPTPEGRNWLYTGFSATFTSPAKGEPKRQVKGDIKMEWTLSGRRGWDKDIYGEGTPDGNNGRMPPPEDRADFPGLDQVAAGRRELGGNVI